MEKFDYSQYQIEQNPSSRCQVPQKSIMEPTEITQYGVQQYSRLRMPMASEN